MVTYIVFRVKLKRYQQTPVAKKSSPVHPERSPWEGYSSRTWLVSLCSLCSLNIDYWACVTAAV